ncbi:MAG: sporulation protein, partial [Psychromonas sp.]|nr:sporulation protein [Psychromonas sp.]
MASQFQNRLVGISMLVATVVIFLPTVIDGKKTAYEDEFVATPIHPEVKAHTQELDVIEPERTEVVANNSELEDAQQVAVESEQD